MPQFLIRAQDWFRARSTAEKAGIIMLAFIVLLAASRVLAFVATLAFFAAVVVLVVQVFRGRPVKAWALAAVGSLAMMILFSSIAGALYGPQTGQGGQGETAEKRAAEPSPPKEPAEKSEAAEKPERKDQKPENAVHNDDPDGDGLENEAALAGSTTDEDDDEFGPTVMVERAVDGDTIEVSPAVDGESTVRLIGIDTPESKEPGCAPQPLGQEAADHAATWEGLEVRLEFDEERRDQYGRLLAYVHDDLIMATSMNVDMIESGYAQVYIVPPNTKYEDELREAQGQAKNLALGFGLDIWSLPPGKDAQLADRGNGIGSGDGACAAEGQSSASATASASASASPQSDPQPNPQPNRNRGGGNVPDSDSPSNASAAGDASAPAGGATSCDQADGPIYIDPNNDPHGLDGNNDGVACEE